MTLDIKVKNILIEMRVSGRHSPAQAQFYSPGSTLLHGHTKLPLERVSEKRLQEKEQGEEEEEEEEEAVADWVRSGSSRQTCCSRINTCNSWEESSWI